MSFIQFNITNFLGILYLATFFTGALGKFVENVYVDGNILTSLEQAYSPENVVRNSLANFTDLIHFTEFIQRKQEVTIQGYNCNLPPIKAYLRAIYSKNVSSNNFYFSWVPLLQYILPKRLFSQPKSTDTDFVNVTAASESMIMNCINVPLIQKVNPIEVVNTERLNDILKSNFNGTDYRAPGVCTLVLFFTMSCRFSILTAPHYEVLSKIFPQIKMTVLNAQTDHWINSIFGVSAVPSLVLVHNGKYITYNNPDYLLYELVEFIMEHTNLEHEENVAIPDYYLVKHIISLSRYPEIQGTDFCLWASWIVIIYWIVTYVRNTYFWKMFVENITIILCETEEYDEHDD